MSDSISATFNRMLRAEGQGKPARTVEVFGWLILIEGTIILVAPHFVSSVLHLPELQEQAANYFRLVGLLVGGLGMLYIVSGRLNSLGFVFASLLDRPLVPPIMVLLWYLDILPWQLAMAFSIQDLVSFFWTLMTWRTQ